MFLLALLMLKHVCGKEKVFLPKGTAIAIKTTVEINTMQKQHHAVQCIVAGDIYDKDGEYVLIEAGTNADVQVQVVRATRYGSAAEVSFTPISVTAINGRLVAMHAKAVYFYGNEAYFTARKQLILQSGTTFSGKTANDMWFTIDVVEDE